MSVKGLKNINFVAERIIANPSLRDIEQFQSFVNTKINKCNVDKFITRNLSDFKKMYSDVLKSWESSRSFSQLTNKEFRKIPMIIALKFDDNKSLLNAEGFLDSYLERIKSTNDYRSARKLFKAVLRSFEEFKDILARVFEVIRPLISGADNRLCLKIKEIDDRFKILTPNIINTIVSQITLPPLPNQRQESVEEIFSKLGISPDLQEGSLGEAIAKSLLAENFKKMTNNDYSLLDRTLEYFVKNDEESIRLDHLHDTIIESLLGPFLTKEPESLIKEKLTKFIDTYFGDPRGNPRWHTVDHEIKKIPIKWKVGVTLSAFFKLLDDVALENEVHAKHWPMRKAFWKELLDNGEILEAWIILGKRYLEVHDSYLEDNLHFGVFSTHKNIQPNHCAIIVKVREYTISEWSHNGATRVYFNNDERAPELYLDKYHPDDLKKLRRKEKGMGSPNDGYIAHSPTSWETNLRKKLGLVSNVRRKVSR